MGSNTKEGDAVSLTVHATPASAVTANWLQLADVQPPGYQVATNNSGWNLDYDNASSSLASVANRDYSLDEKARRAAGRKASAEMRQLFRQVLQPSKSQCGVASVSVEELAPLPSIPLHEIPTFEPQYEVPGPESTPCLSAAALKSNSKEPAEMSEHGVRWVTYSQASWNVQQKQTCRDYSAEEKAKRAAERKEAHNIMKQQGNEPAASTEHASFYKPGNNWNHQWTNGHQCVSSPDTRDTVVSKHMSTGSSTCRRGNEASDNLQSQWRGSKETLTVSRSRDLTSEERASRAEERRKQAQEWRAQRGMLQTVPEASATSRAQSTVLSSTHSSKNSIWSQTTTNMLSPSDPMSWLEPSNPAAPLEIKQNWFLEPEMCSQYNDSIGMTSSDSLDIGKKSTPFPNSHEDDTQPDDGALESQPPGSQLGLVNDEKLLDLCKDASPCFDISEEDLGNTWGTYVNGLRCNIILFVGAQEPVQNASEVSEITDKEFLEV